MDFNFGSTNRTVLRGTCTSHIRRHPIDMCGVCAEKLNRALGWVSECATESSARVCECAVHGYILVEVWSNRDKSLGNFCWYTIWCLNGMNLIRTFILDAFCSSIYLFELYFTAQATYHYVSFHFCCCCCCCCWCFTMETPYCLLVRISSSPPSYICCSARSLCLPVSIARTPFRSSGRPSHHSALFSFPSIAYDDFNLENWINILLFATIVHEN